MDFRAIFVALLFALTKMQAKQLQPGPLAIKDSSSTSSAPSIQKSQKRYATKEIVLYLTPSQIRALQGGKGLVSPQTVSQPKEAQEQNDNRLTSQEHEEFVRQQFENIKSAKISQLEKPQHDNLELFSHGSSYKKGELPTITPQKILDLIEIWKMGQLGIEKQAQSQYLISQQWLPNERDSESEGNAWISSKSVSEKKQEELLLHEQLQQQWNRILKQNRIQLATLSIKASEKEKSESLSAQTEKPLLQIQYAPRYNDQKNAIEIEKILRNRHRQELERESELIKAEAIANSPPILIHEEIKVTNHRPVPVVQRVNVEVPTPVLIPVPEPFEVKVPHPYPVPLEIVRHIPVPILKTEKDRSERPVSENKSRYSLPKRYW